MEPTDPVATALRLSFASYANLEGHDAPAARAAVTRTLSFFRLPGAIEWFAISDDRHRFNFALAFVVVDRGPQSTSFSVIVRGTNPLSLESWFREDFDIGLLVPWSSDPTTGQISQAASTALSLHEALEDQGQNLYGFLAQRIQKEALKGRSCTVLFTGHSLGGVLAPLLALRFSEAHSRFENATFDVVTFAAPTPGNAAFARHLETSFLGRTNQSFATLSFVRCFGDLAVRVWNVKAMLGIVRLYGAWGVPINLFLVGVLRAVIWSVARKGYVQPFDGEPQVTRFHAPVEFSFFPDDLDAEAFLDGEFKKQFQRAREITRKRPSLKVFRSTLAWILQAVVMHLVPYATKFLAPHEVAFVRDTILKTILTQDVLFVERRVQTIAPPQGGRRHDD